MAVQLQKDMVMLRDELLLLAIRVQNMESKVKTREELERKISEVKVSCYNVFRFKKVTCFALCGSIDWFKSRGSIVTNSCWN